MSQRIVCDRKRSLLGRNPTGLGKGAEQRAGGERMTAQEWIDELERLREAAIMPPYYLRKKLFFGEDEEEYYITDKEERIICRMKYMSTEPDNAAYIVAACNAVPRLVEMLRIAVSLIEAQNAQRARKGERIPDIDVMQLLFTMTEPKG